MDEALPAHDPVTAQTPLLARPAKATPTSKACSAKPPPLRPRPTAFLGERYRHLVRRRGKLKALVAVEPSILVIVWHLLADPTARYHDLGADVYANPINRDRKTRNLVHQLQALGHHVTLQPIAMAA
jgi:hypothetical protein